MDVGMWVFLIVLLIGFVWSITKLGVRTILWMRRRRTILFRRWEIPGLPITATLSMS